MTVNIDALKQLRDAINQHPEHFSMDTWFRLPVEDDYDGEVLPHDYNLSEVTPVVEEFVHTCGTSACLAGWAVLLFRDQLPAEPDEQAVAEFLGVRSSVFYEDTWQEEYRTDGGALEGATMILDDLINGDTFYARRGGYGDE